MVKDVRAGVNEVRHQEQTRGGASREFDNVSKIDERHRYTVPVRLFVRLLVINACAQPKERVCLMLILNVFL